MTDLPISALRAFRALARCGSFTAAARDLGCAQSAVSRHIAALEAHLQQTLVLRGHRRVQFTQAGAQYLETVQRVLDELDQGTARIARAGARPTVKILAMPSFAARWLIPRCAPLRSMPIDAEIELATSIWDADFHRERFDLAVHYGDGAWPGATLLVHDSLVPVASPRLVGTAGLERIDDLARFCWLHDSLRSSKWPRWLAAQGAEHLATDRHMKLQDTEATLAAAVAGVGIAMGHAALVDNDVREGRLVLAWPAQVPLAAGYHLLQSRRAARNAAAQALAAWLLGEAEAFRRTRPAPG
ncbi:LysR substrate-binding domain-containing protein [Acidovorax sp. GBBC 3334]|uniref:LysR substrate-binding domain-containing protein n=1 Tax=Acidovorax sp. GBBC 3334 TaxID=2940496 RepID=UPI0023022640|nr:LysR substrate-binding domain-containing protein [Acidovorax sp. GBBC 3334]MDA8455342.1 LysR substrate-binding domain-containing protein [Acidovorax sp. GBBC 3334]